jgi:hypothetical protein
VLIMINNVPLTIPNHFILSLNSIRGHLHPLHHIRAACNSRVVVKERGSPRTIRGLNPQHSSGKNRE